MVKVVIFDARGEKIREDIILAISGINTVNLKSDNLIDGVYFANISNNNFIESVKFIKN